MPDNPNMDRFHEGPSLRGYDSEADHQRNCEAEDLARQKHKDPILFHERESLGFVFKPKEDKAMKCEICDTENPRWSWTDTHGVAQCITCGAAYRLLHYDDDNKRVEKPPELAFAPEYVAAIKTYWSERHRKIPGGHSFHQDYEQASPSDCDAFYKWMKANADLVNKT